MRVMTFLFALILGISAAGLQAQECTVSSTYCVDNSPVIVDGITIPDVCKKRIIQYECPNENVRDDCTVVAADTANCSETASVCLIEQLGQCVDTLKTYLCLNADPDLAPATLVQRRALNVDDQIIGNCTELSEDSLCNAVSNTCTDATPTKPINHIPISRSCWAWERVFNCQSGEQTDTCGEFIADPACREIRSECLVEENGICTHYDVTYECGDDEVEGPPNCESQRVCVGGLCAEYEAEPSDDFLNAQAWLKFLDEASKDRDAQTDTIFTGIASYCRIKGLGYKNCCSGSGWGLGLNLANCRESELVLKAAREAGSTVYIGTRCMQKILGHCISKRRMYCQFNSKFGRIAQEQIRDQLGRDFGSYAIPNCNGLTVTTLESVDMEELDFSEAFPEIAGDTNTPEDAEYQRRILERLNLQ